MAKTKGSFRDLLREKGTAPAQPETTLVRGQGFAITDAAPPDDVTLPLDAETQLGSELYQIARHYLGARRRMGAALLDMVRTLLHARQIADDGTWYVFLELTYTKPDTAELLLNIARRAEENAGYADAIVRGHFNQTVAGELARPSTPPAVIAQLLTTTEPPRVADVKRARREYRLYQQPASANVIPNNSGRWQLVRMIPSLWSCHRHQRSIGTHCWSRVVSIISRYGPYSKLLRRVISWLTQMLRVCSIPSSLIFSTSVISCASTNQLDIKKRGCMTINGPLDPLHLARPNPARMYDDCLGQSHNFPLDRRAVETLDTVFPTIRMVAQANHLYLQRARQFVRDALDITQMLDIGCGMYMASPFERAVYGDHDPIVDAFNGQVTSFESAQTTLLADLRAPETILSADAVQLLDWTQPIALVLGDVLPYVPDDADALSSVQHLVAALPEGSALILSHPWLEGQEELAEAVTATYATWAIPYI
ncbi:MAG: hypothetical protein HC828_19275, partial [Blastochloris sp.]|nr:hypothetical protein [Blastochloris sp.]